MKEYLLKQKLILKIVTLLISVFLHYIRAGKTLPEHIEEPFVLPTFSFRVVFFEK